MSSNKKLLSVSQLSATSSNMIDSMKQKGGNDEVARLKRELQILQDAINTNNIQENDINTLAQAGGAKKKTSKKSSKKVSKKGSKKGSKKDLKTMNGGVKKSSKKVSKKTSKKGSKNQKAGDPLAKYREFVKFVQTDMGLKGGPLTNTFAAHFRSLAKKKHPEGSQDEINDAAIKIYNDEKKAGKLEKIYEQVKEKAGKDREAKKAIKQQEKLRAKEALKQMKAMERNKK